MTFPVYADKIKPASRIVDAALVAGFSLLIAISAQISIPLPFTPVPVTFQTMMVLAAGALLGSRRGTAAVLLYLTEGFAGLPVFSMGRSGIGHLIGPTGGYLVGFLAAAWLAGYLAEKGWDRKWITALAGLVIADLTVYLPGVLWLGLFTGFSRVLLLGALPFAAADAVKAAACAALLPLGWKALSRARL